MSVFGFLISGASAMVTGDLPPKAQAAANSIARDFVSRVLNLASSGSLAATAPRLDLADCTYLFVGCDKVNMHFGFVRASVETTVNYRDFTGLGQLELQAILQPLREEVGEILWSFSCPYSNVPPAWTARYLDTIASQYVGAALRPPAA
jgi:hypothetical protein